MKKNIYIVSLLAAACAAGFASCSDDEEYDFPGDPNNRVYTPDQSAAFKMVQTPAGAFGALDARIPAKCNQKASADIKVTLEIDNSLIEAYNEANGTSCQPMPQEALIIENQTMTIPAGAMASADTTRITLVDDQAILQTLDASGGYIIPVRMTTVAGGGSAPANSVKSISYLTMTVTNDAVNHDATIEDAKGTPVADQSGWSLSGNVDTSDGSKLFDGDGKNYTSFESSDPMELIVDMGKVYEFDAIEAKYSYGWGSYSYDYGSLPDGTNIYLSTDGMTWQSVATTEGGGYYGTQYVIFWGYMSARYIKLEIPLQESYWGDPSATFECGYFNVYAK